MSTPLHVWLHHERCLPVLSVAGELDLYTARTLRVDGERLVDQALAPAPELVSTAKDTPADSDSHVYLGVAPTGRVLPRPTGEGTPRPAGSREILVLDVAAVPFVDSSGLGAIVAVLKRVRAHHAGLSIAGANDQLRAVLHLMGLDKMIMLHATAEEAVQAASDAPMSGKPSTPDLRRG